SIIIIQLRANGTIEGNLFTVYSLNYGLVLEATVLSFAMADRIRYIKKEREDALKEKNEAQQKIIAQLRINDELKDKVNRELEDKVIQRTRELHDKNAELEDTNSRLKEMTERANQMSLKLDLDNWNLQKNIKEAIKARMSSKEVSYSEFNKIFPDEITCLRYLDELKWHEDFKCRKCGNTKYISGVKVFSRKCTRCGYPESVTAYTLFHGLRFPINKAFYMTYLIHKKNKITLDELSVLIDLRRNTCWNFKKKVLASIDKYQKIKKRPLETWEEIIMLAD
ncbi:MAG: transposase, partial [Cytophagaceae bacterium]|nr:transposase [Cytophagaceae bacterium]